MIVVATLYLSFGLFCWAWAVAYESTLFKILTSPMIALWGPVIVLYLLVEKIIG